MNSIRKFSLATLFWLIVVAALATAWWSTRTKLNVATTELAKLLTFRDGDTGTNGVTGSNPKPVDGIAVWIVECEPVVNQSARFQASQVADEARRADQAETELDKADK